MSASPSFHPRQLPRIALVVLALLAGPATLPLSTPDAAQAAPEGVVISQVFGGGGSSAAVPPRDFIELFNRGGDPISLAGWSIQYASATGDAWHVTDLLGAIPPGEHYLIVLGPAGRPTAPMPAPNATGGTDLASRSGKVALVRHWERLACSSSAACLADPAVVDLVGIAGASAFEGTAAEAPAAGQAIARDAAGTDTGDNAADFAPAPPRPRATAAAGLACVRSAPRIHAIQGAAHRSPLEGCLVSGVVGSVTGVQANGFFLQDPVADGDAATAEGLFVVVERDAGLPAVAVGDVATVAGRVVEERSGGRTSPNLTTTRIRATSLELAPGAGSLPAAVIIGIGGRLPPAMLWDPSRGENVEAAGAFDPATNALDFYESLEGMRVRVADPVVVGPRADTGEVVVLASGGAGVEPRTGRGGVILGPGDVNPERIVLDDDLLSGTARPPIPAVDVGDRLVPPCCEGIVDYGAPGTYRVLLTQLPAAVSGGLAREAMPGAGSGVLAITTFNVENLDPGDGAATFARLAHIIVDDLAAPDLIAVEEIQDRNGPANDSVVDATATYAMLTEAITAAGGPCYQFRQIDPRDGQDGGEPGGNIRQGLLFRTDRGLGFVDRPGGDATTAVTVEPGGHLSISPGRIAPDHPAFAGSRKPLAAELTFHGQPLVVIANHFASKGGDEPQWGRRQPPREDSLDQRIDQAQVVRDFVDALLEANPAANIVVLGDLNDFAFSEPVRRLTEGGPVERGLQNLIETLPEAERYSYVFAGNAQALDHILVSAPLATAVAAFDVVHVNAEFAEQASDHDPSVVHLALPAVGTPVPPVATPVASTCHTTFG